MVTLSATGGPATAALAPPQHLQPGPVSQPPAEVSAAALQNDTVSAATGEQSHSSSAGPAVQPPVRLAESQGSSVSNTTASEQSHSDSRSTHQHRGFQSEQPLHSALAGMSLGEDSPDLRPAHAAASEPDQAGSEQHSESPAPGFDDPLRSSHRPAARQGDVAAEQQQQVTGAQSTIDLPLFTGFVSHEQLETAIGSTSYERRLASSRELTHWVKMRGPGVQLLL